jgi:hypothetical protein
MTDLQTLFRTIDELTPEEKQQVVEYIQEHQATEPSVQPRVFDLHAGVIAMSDDFDEELPLSFWLGEK